ncbi:MAG: L-2-hydroxyglutarate oxidase [Planctomycetaceae bacterium]|nr:L-2-hydroxyglutarate oxidase [Planctomycetaceae bacterium]
MQSSDVIVIGGGIVGLATAYQMQQRYPERSITILEKEPSLAHHQTGHNSGVLHSGIYYRPGSLKAINCRQGKLAMQRFCEEHEIPFEVCGKVIVAINESELPALSRIFERGQENHVQCEIIDRERLFELEPHVAGVQAIHVPETGIVDYVKVCKRLAEILTANGHQIVTSARVTGVDQRTDQITVSSTTGEFSCQLLVNCSGLQSDRIAKLTGADPKAKIVPFRGEYYQLKPSAFHLCRNLIYPVPDPNFPFLGVHFTRMIDGSVECGPNAVLAFAREGYRKTDINLHDLFESLTYPGFLKLAAKYWRVGVGEVWRSASKAAFVRALQRLVPEINSRLLESAPAGVRAQAVAEDGAMIDDFLILDSDRVINVCNAPSPAATSALQIGDTIVDRLASRLDN